MSDAVTSTDNAETGDSESQPTRRRLLTGAGAAAVGAGVLAIASTPAAQAAVTAGLYYSITPERVVDTRVEGGRISLGQSRLEDILVGDGLAAVCNVTVANTASSGYLTLYNADEARPAPFSTINWQGAGKIVANLAIFDLGESGFRVFCGGSAGASTNYVVDLIGFMETPLEAARSPRARQFEDTLQRKLARLPWN